MEKTNWSDWFYYDETSPSCLRWKVEMRFGKYKQSVHKYAGDIAGTKGVNSFTISLKGTRYQAHRVVFELYNTEIPDRLLIDHLDGDCFNNKIEIYVSLLSH